MKDERYQVVKKIKEALGFIPRQTEASFLLDDERFQAKPMKKYTTSLGTYYVPKDAHGDVIAAAMKKGEIFEPEIVAIAKRYITEGSLVLDVGSNFGQMALLFADYVGKSGQVLAFEADEYIFQILHKNIAANNVHNIRAYYAAVYNTKNEKMFYPEQDFKRFSSYGSYGLSPQAVEGRVVETLTIDSLDIQEPISFMKVDIQGSDLFALQGAIETIKRHQMPIIFEFEQQFQKEFNTTFQDYIDFINAISYKVEEVVNGINYLILPKSKSEKHYSISVKKQEEPIFCGFLQTRDDVYKSTSFLHRNGYVSHRLLCKDWDLANIIPHINDGNFLDMGSTDSYILKNIFLKRIQGELHGIDFCEPDIRISGVLYHVGDLMDTHLPADHFQNITCLSVLEHQVDFTKIAREASRLLKMGGRFFVTFDYWNPKITNTKRLYNLAWQPLDKQMVCDFVAACQQYGLKLVQGIDWNTRDAVIKQGYYSPQENVAYTFGMVVFQRE